MEPEQARLFDEGPLLPEGFVYRPAFVTTEEEQAILAAIAGLSFGEVRMRNVTARRRVAQFGWRYAFETTRLTESQPIPPFLEPLRERAAELAGLPADGLAEALVTEYPPNAPIGWHRDAPMFGLVIGISLLSPCRFQLRRDANTPKVEITLEPRSAYVLAGPARTEWHHHIPPVRALRYSITFRTLRKSAR